MVAEIIRLRAALDASEGRHRSALEGATEHAITTNRQGRITGWNVGARRMLGWTKAEMLQRHVGLIFTLEDRTAGVPEAEIYAALSKGVVENERWHMNSDGGRVWRSAQFTPLRDNGVPASHLKVMRDGTAQHVASEGWCETTRECERI